MKLRNTVLENKSEAKIFHPLELRWSPKFKVFPSLPLSNIFEVDSNELTVKEEMYFNKTNVDYTLCEENNRPIFSIEFDGAVGRFNRDGMYILECEIDDPVRSQLIELKLKVAEELNYPFMLISYEKIKYLDEEDILTIIEGIIGHLLARVKFRRLSNRIIDDYNGQIGELHGSEKDKDFQDLEAVNEDETELAIDPIDKKAAKYEQKCAEFGISKHRLEYLSDPPLFGIEHIFDVEIIKAQINSMKHIARIGCLVLIESPKIVIVKSVWIRNFDGFGVGLFSIARNIAKYLAFKKAYSLLSIRSKEICKTHSTS